MNVYIASEYDDREWARMLADGLRALGHVVTATWLDGSVEPNDPNNQTWKDQVDQWARRDLRDVGKSNAFVLKTKERKTPNTNGRIFEAGWAMARGCPLFVIGPRTENIFIDSMAEEQFGTGSAFLLFVTNNWRGR